MDDSIISVNIEPNDENKTDKNSVTDKLHIPMETTNKDDNSKPHNGEPITRIEISPKGNYLVTYSKEDNSFVGWNVENTDDKGRLKFVHTDIKADHEVKQIRISDDKKLAYIDYYDDDDKCNLKIIDMNDNKEIKLYFNDIIPDYCTFNLEGEFILHSNYEDYKGIIFIYSTQTTKNNEWNCKKVYKIPKDFELISISKYDKLYLLSNDYYYVYEWNILTEKGIRIFGNDDRIINMYNTMNTNIDNTRSYATYLHSDDYKLSDIGISCNEKFIRLKIRGKIIIYSAELEVPIASLVIFNDAYRLYNCMNDLENWYPLLFSLFDNELTTSSGIWKESRSTYTSSSSDPEIHYYTSINPFLFDNTTKFIFEILDGYVRKIKLEESISENNFSFKNFNELSKHENHKTIESWNNIRLFNSYLDTIHELFRDAISKESSKERTITYPFELTKLIKLEVDIDHLNCENFQLSVHKKINVNSEWDLICKNKTGDYVSTVYIAKLCNNNDIVILTNIGLFIYYFNESDKSISLNYFYYMKLNGVLDIKEEIKYDKNVFSKPTLPLPNYISFKLDTWVSSIKDNKLRLLKYGVELLSFAIKEHKLKLIDDIYTKCINYFKQDLKNNGMLLSIISSTTMPILNEYYPDYILRYSSETIMIIDSPSYSIEYKNNNLHLYSFSQYSQIVNLTRSILWTKYTCLLNTLYSGNKIMFWILKCIEVLITLLIFPIFYILSRYHFIHNAYNFYERDTLSRIYFYIFNKISSKFSRFSKYTTAPTTPTITFMIPYIKFVNYPQDYNRNWLWELIRPHPSPFVKTISRDIYKTWDGEALLNFKWNTYGKYYYAIIWIIFMAFFGCFTTAATIPLAEDVRNKLLISTITLGFIHLITEVRQIIYDSNNWIRDLWNFFDIIAYLFPICTSIYWIQTDDMITWLLSFSCLFLYIKLVMFFRVFEYFGVYFAIIISVGKQIISFLVVLSIIIIGFAHAFYILLLPRSDNDPNSPLNLATTYNKVLDNGTMDSNPFIIQSPGDNTNMFKDYRTSILAMYFFLTGDSSSLTNWSYTKHPSLVILIVLFSLLVVVYLMNLFIGLLSNAIEKDNNRVSYLIQKAEILAEIELFYLLPNQRRWQTWFPDTIYYYASVDKTREKINEMINKGEWKTNDFPEMKKRLLEKLNIRHNHDKLAKIVEEVIAKMDGL